MWRQFGVALIALMVLDGLWLGVLMKDFYRRSLAPIARMANGGFEPIDVYDLTNHAVLRDWRAAMTPVDIGWGAVTCGFASWVAAALVARPS
jgi:uncharacterized membrane protein